MTNQSNNKPIKTFRDRALKAVVWENKHEDKTYRTVDLYRTYKDKSDDQLKDISNYTGSELLRIARLAEKAYDFLLEQQQLDKQFNQTEGAQ